MPRTRRTTTTHPPATTRQGRSRQYLRNDPSKAVPAHLCQLTEPAFELRELRSGVVFSTCRTFDRATGIGACTHLQGRKIVGRICLDDYQSSRGFLTLRGTDSPVTIGPAPTSRTLLVLLGPANVNERLLSYLSPDLTASPALRTRSGKAAKSSPEIRHRPLAARFRGKHFGTPSRT